MKDELEAKGIGKDKTYLFDTAQEAERQQKRKKKNHTFGWDVFNDESLYNAYFKRAKAAKDAPTGVDAMVEDLEK